MMCAWHAQSKKRVIVCAQTGIHAPCEFNANETLPQVDSRCPRIIRKLPRLTRVPPWATGFLSLISPLARLRERRLVDFSKRRWCRRAGKQGFPPRTTTGRHSGMHAQTTDLGRGAEEPSNNRPMIL